jgi:hypothetical protein
MPDKVRQESANRAATTPSLGLGVDAHGGPVIDPTQNVLDLVGAAIKRIDDMASLQAQLVNEKIQNAEAMAQVRAQHSMDFAKLRANHQVALDGQESKRLDSVRMIDQLAVKTESDRASLAITALANTTALTAETLRAAVGTSAQSLATQLDRTVSAINERIAQLEKSSYTGMGKQAVADPQLEKLAEMVASLTRHTAASAGKSEGIGTSWTVLVAAAALIIAGVSWLNPRASVQPQAQVMYLPAPTGTMLPAPPTSPAMVPGK